MGLVIMRSFKIRYVFIQPPRQRVLEAALGGQSRPRKEMISADLGFDCPRFFGGPSRCASAPALDLDLDAPEPSLAAYAHTFWKSSGLTRMVRGPIGYTLIL